MQRLLQNRVTPFGELVATPERGMFTGNRGIIHDPATRTLSGRRWTTKAWIVCSCQYKGINRSPIWTRRSWTELFFLDEATALAAGHRPCFTCQRDAAKAFAEAFAKGNGLGSTSAPEMDTILHRERVDGRAKRRHPLTAPPDTLPDGAMVAAGEDAYLITTGKAHRWSFGGYAATTLPAIDALLTPPSTLNALRAGYRPVLDPSVGEAADL